MSPPLSKQIPPAAPSLPSVPEAPLANPVVSGPADSSPAFFRPLTAISLIWKGVSAEARAPRQAALFYRNALEIYPENALAHRRLAQTLFTMAHRRTAEVEEHVNQSIQYETSLDGLRESLAVLKKMKVEDPESDLLSQMGLHLNGRDAQLNALYAEFGEDLAKRGLELLKKPGQQKQALALLEKAYTRYRKKDPAFLEVIAEQRAAAGNYRGALQTAGERRFLGFASPEQAEAFDLKCGAWAEANGDMILARRLYFSDVEKGPFSPPALEHLSKARQQAVVKLYASPQRWADAVEKKISEEDYAAAEALLKEAELVNHITIYRRQSAPPGYESTNWWTRFIVHNRGALGSMAQEIAPDGSPNLVSTKELPDDDPKVTAQLARQRLQVTRFRDGIEGWLKQELTATQEKLKKAKGKDFERLNAHQEKVQELLSDVSRLNFFNLSTAYQRLQRNVEYLQSKASLTSQDFEDVRRDAQQLFDSIPEVPELQKYRPILALYLAQSHLLPLGHRAQLEMLSTSVKNLADLGQVGLRHLDASLLIRRAKLALVSGMESETSPSWREGKRILAALTRYAEMEPKKEELFEIVRSFYPANTPLAFLSAEKIAEKKKNRTSISTPLSGAYTPTPEQIEALPIVAATKKSFLPVSPAEQRIAQQGVDILKNLRESADMYIEGWKEHVVQGYREMLPSFWTVAHLEGLNANLEKLYGTSAKPYNDRFLLKVVEAAKLDEDKKIKDDAGQQLRAAFPESMAAFKQFQALHSVVFAEIHQGERQLNNREAAQIRDFLLKRGQARLGSLETYVRILHDRRERWLETQGVQKNDVLARAHHNLNAEGREKEEIVRLSNAEAALESYRKAFTPIEEGLKGLSWGSDFKYLSALEIPPLETAAQWLAASEEQHLQSLLRYQVDELKSLAEAALPPFLVDFEKQLQAAAALTQDPEKRLSLYQGLQKDIDDHALPRFIQARMEELKAKESEVKLNDGIVNFFGKIDSFLFSNLDSYLQVSPWQPWNNRRAFEEMIAHYQSLLDKLNSGDPQKREEARNEFGILEGASMHGDLQSSYSFASDFNGYLSTATMIIPAGFVGNIAGTLAKGLLIGLGRGMLAQAIAFGVGNAVGFTVGLRGMHGLVYGGWEGFVKAMEEIKDNPGAFLEESAINGGMMLAVWGASVGWMKAYGGIMTKVATRRLLAQGIPPVGRALEMELSLLHESFWPFLLRTSGSFATQVVAFQIYDFAKYNYLFAKMGRFEPGLAAKATFSMEAWKHGTLFLAALKVSESIALITTRSARAPLDSLLESRKDKKNRLELEQEVASLEAERVSIDADYSVNGDFGAALGRYQGLANRTLAIAYRFAPHLTANLLIQKRMELPSLLKQLYTDFPAFEAILGEKNSFSVRFRGGDLFSYDPSKHESLEKALRQHPWAKQEMEISSNGLIEVHFQVPLLPDTLKLRFYPETQQEIAPSPVPASTLAPSDALFAPP